MQTVTIQRQAVIVPIPSIDVTPIIRLMAQIRSQTMVGVRFLYRISTIQSFMTIWTAPVE